ncbi:MAG: cyclase family protein [Chitinophagales bacterium]
MPQYIDLSHTIEDGLVTYKGLPAPIICDYLSREASKGVYAEGASFQIGKIEMVANTGTYIDVPFHRYEDGKDLSEFEVEAFANLEAICIHAPCEEGLEVGVSFFEGKDLKGKAVMVRTDWAQHWNTPQYYENHSFLTKEAALFLKEAEVKLVGIDSHNIDDTRSNARPVHSILLKNDILIAEHLCNMQGLPLDKPFRFFAVPPKVKGMGTFPVRAYAILGT